MRLRFVALFLVLVLGAISAAGFLYFRTLLTQPGPLKEELLIYVAPGKGTNAISEALLYSGAFDVQGSLAFKLDVRLQGAKLKAGEYAIAAGSSIHDIVLLLQSGKTYQRRITIPEGLMSFEIVALINAAEAMSGEITLIPPEGTLLPETYHYSYGDDRNKLIGRLQEAMQETLAALWEQRMENLPVATPEEAVILASVVEKETGLAAERAKVAGVFVNRLRLRMPLQSDPTVIYALTQGKARLERPLLRKDLEISSPYNTYKAQGLPPTPIANPGEESLRGVLHPEAHDYIYFVADGTGGHSFGKTLDEHLRNVARWRQIQKNSSRFQADR